MFQMPPGIALAIRSMEGSTNEDVVHTFTDLSNTAPCHVIGALRTAEETKRQLSPRIQSYIFRSFSMFKSDVEKVKQTFDSGLE